MPLPKTCDGAPCSKTFGSEPPRQQRGGGADPTATDEHTTRVRRNSGRIGLPDGKGTTPGKRCCARRSQRAGSARPARAVRAPKRVVKRGKTPVLVANDEPVEQLRPIG